MEGETWAAFGMATLSLIGTAISTFNARALARDKLEFERSMARDKMEFDACRIDLESRLDLVSQKLADCTAQHERSEIDRVELREKIDAIEADRTDLRRQLDDVRAKLAGLEA